MAGLITSCLEAGLRTCINSAEGVLDVQIKLFNKKQGLKSRISCFHVGLNPNTANLCSFQYTILVQKIPGFIVFTKAGKNVPIFRLALGFRHKLD